jgi:predicted N-acetyltransferase YhbS
MDGGKLLIREENQDDIAAIAEVTVAAFKTLAISSHTEHFIVDGLGLPGVPPEVFFALSFDGSMPRGEVVFHPGFQATGR